MWDGIKKIFRSYFVAGLLVLGPLVISVWVANIIIQSADETLRTHLWLPVHIPGLGLVLAILIILITGFLARNILGRLLFFSVGDLVGRIPVVGKVYSSTKQVFEALLSGQGSQFGKVVFLEYPHENSWTIGFVTSQKLPPAVSKALGPDMVSVYVPTTPNPTSGFYLFVPKNRIKDTDLSVEEAFKTVVSLGLANSKKVELQSGN